MTSSSRTVAAVSLGLALGGFFDGILLHQILQWHHLLSLVPAAGDLRWQVFWDGVFHAATYLVAAAALYGLLRPRRDGEAMSSGRRLAGSLLAGFGLWHVLDALLSHWLLGIHRIRLDAADPLAWDLAWVVAFGLAPLVAGLALIRRDGPPPSQRSHAAALGVVLAVTVGAAAWSIRPPPDAAFATVVFHPGVGPAGVAAALAAAEARLVWADGAMGVVVLDVDPARRWDLYRSGALLVGSSSAAIAGCIAWTGV